MSLVVGMAEDGGVAMGSDGCVTVGNLTYIVSDPKVFRTPEGLLVGVCGSVRTQNILQYLAALPSPEGVGYDEAVVFMHRKFIPVVQMALSAAGYLKEENGVQEMDSSLLVGVAGRLFTVYGDFSVVASTTGVAAIGSGEDFALGCLEAVDRVATIGVDAAIRMALEIATKYCSGVSRPFFFERVDPPVPEP